MKHYINPTIDCVFKAILGCQQNAWILCHFLNSILLPKSPITSVTITNPYNERDYLGDKLTIVDIKAKDAADVIYQIEIQLSTPTYLAKRMLYLWTDIYGAQIVKGEDYSQLKPAISIWLLTENLFSHTEDCHNHYELVNRKNQHVLTDHLAIHILELKKWKLSSTLQAEDFWLYFFKEGKHFKELPPLIDIPELRQAMTVLEAFSEQEHAYHIYRSRLDAERDQLTRDRMFEKATADAKAAKARADEERANAEEAKARAEKAETEVLEVRTRAESAEATLAKAQEEMQESLLRSGLQAIEVAKMTKLTVAEVEAFRAVLKP
ncbi:MAG: putative transposase/invertase (TIGR01784 family) [Phenylobacterium sp.]|jgi:predicted transposase/invertase (TIGR01784 family)